MQDDLTEHLGTFDSRYTMRHTRTYSHVIEHVWEAVTTASAP